MKGNTMNTQTQLAERFNTDLLAHLPDDIVPVLSGVVQRQGDVIVVPMRAGLVAGLVSVPREGIAVVRGENDGNTHLLVADGDVQFAPAPASRGSLLLGSLVIAENATAYLTHPEHGFMGFGPGHYVIKRQREQADEIRLVQD